MGGVLIAALVRRKAHGDTAAGAPVGTQGSAGASSVREMRNCQKQERRPSVCRVGAIARLSSEECPRSTEACGKATSAVPTMLSCCLVGTTEECGQHEPL